MGDGVIENISENDPVVASFPSIASGSDLHSLEPSDTVKVRGILSAMCFCVGKVLFLVTDICF